MVRVFQKVGQSPNVLIIIKSITCKEFAMHNGKVQRLYVIATGPSIIKPE